MTINPNKLVNLGATHFRQLGVALPDPRFYVPRRSGSKHPLFYASAQRIEGRDFSGSLADQIVTSEEQAALAGLATTLRRYFDWVQTTGQSHALTDITGLHQYRYGHPQGANPDTPDQLYLLDFEPRPAYLGPAWREQVIDDELGTLESWAPKPQDAPRQTS